MSVWPRASAEAQIAGKVRMVVADEASIGVLSTGEQIAVALVLERMELLPPGYRSALEAVNRLGDAWLAAALRVQREGWEA